MKVWPVLLDAEPTYLGRSATGVSLLGAPMGRGLLVSQLCEQIERVTSEPPTIVVPHGVSDENRALLAQACPAAVIATSARALADSLAGAEMSDVLLFVDPRCLPVDSDQLVTMMASAAAQPQVARHLVAYAADIAGTRESVTVDDEGLVRSVHRYYKPATWPFIAGVAVSLVPVASDILPLSAIPASLLDLRQQLVTRGVPSRDIAVRDGTFDLTEEHGMLAAVEHSVRHAVDQLRAGESGTPLLVGRGQCIAPSARLIGPVIVQSGARIDANVTVVGPSLIGANAHIGAGAVVAHVALGAGAEVAEGQVVRDRVWYAAASTRDGRDFDIDRRAAVESPSFTQRLARIGVESGDPESAAAVDNMPARAYSVLKRGIDLTLSVLALVALSPLLAIISVLVWIDSRGPVLFLHTREGVGGRLFNCLKFRTMRVGANELQRKLKSQDQLDGPHFKMESDPRITRVGRWLRTTNVDELPQLVNVLIGDMSLVGPRPSPFRENQICVPWRKGRLSVRPGITGLWQVCRQDRAAGDFHQWIEYDLLYVQHMGLLLDLKVLVATVFTLGGKYPVPVSWLVRLPARPAQVADAAPRVGNSSALAHAESPARSAQ